jgi:hypothetical protein
VEEVGRVHQVVLLEELVELAVVQMVNCVIVVVGQIVGMEQQIQVEAVVVIVVAHLVRKEVTVAQASSSYVTPLSIN